MSTNKKRLAIGSIGMLFILVSIWQIWASTNGLDIIRVSTTHPKMTIFKPKDNEPGSSPVVLIGHGFAGSEVLMRGFAITLAHAGYTAISWDFDGHGANPKPMSSSLIENAEAVLAWVKSNGLAQLEHVAILGHSMGSGVALEFGQKYPETAATIAISPAGRSVTTELPHNLLLLAGSLETTFVNRAEQLLIEAGGPGGDPAEGTARKLIIIPNVEHISILFSSNSQAAVRDWLNSTFGVQPGSAVYTDQRMLWYCLGLLGFGLLSHTAIFTTYKPASKTPERPLWRRLLALVGGAISATLVLWGLSITGLELRNMLGLLVGGYLLVWFGVAGLFSWLILWLQPPTPKRREVFSGLVIFSMLWLSVGLLGNFVWLQWLLIPSRLILWPLGTVLLLPLFLSFGEMARHANLPGQIGWWLFNSICVAGSLFLALRLSPSLGFLILILPVIPIMLGLHRLFNPQRYSSWSFALSGALFISWTLLSVFPFQ